MSELEQRQAAAEQFGIGKVLSPELAEIGSMSQTDVAHRQHAKAMRRLESAQIELVLMFEELATAGEAMGKAGITVQVRFSPEMEAAWKAWEAKRREGTAGSRP